MLCIAAYLLAVLDSNYSSNFKDLKKILDSVGIETYDKQLKNVISELSGKNTEDVIAQESSNLASMPTNGAIAIAPSAGSAAPAAAEEKKEKKEESEVSDNDMGFGLFD